MTTIPAGWPCATLSDTPPSVADRLSAPTADDVLPQLLQLTPRGPAWGTDEAGPGTGANPVMLQVWRALADHAAANYRGEFDLASQCFPSAITWSLPDWEEEYELPDACFSGATGTAARVSAVRARFGALGGQSPAYFVCLAKSIGYEITIEEPTQFLCDVSECEGGGPVETWFLIDESVVSADLAETWLTIDTDEIGEDGACLEGFMLAPLGEGDPLEAFVLAPTADDSGDQVAGGLVELAFRIDDGELDGTPLESVDDDPNGIVWKFWIIHVASLGATWFEIDTGELTFDPLEGFLPASDLECLMRRLCPPHTELVFSYSLAGA